MTTMVDGTAAAASLRSVGNEKGSFFVLRLHGRPVSFCHVCHVCQIYYDGQTYYALEASKEIDNPDQRIAEDVRAFTQVSLEFLITVLTSCIDLASFSTILYS